VGMCSPLTSLFRHRCCECRQAVRAAPFSQTVRSTGRLTRLDRSAYSDGSQPGIPTQTSR
jgi:hypothetical protein